MKQKRLILSLLLLVATFVGICQTPNASQIVNGKITSKILGTDKEFSVYLPAGYETSGERYPVLYLLHGAWGMHEDWARKGNAQLIADQEISSGMALPMIIVMPDARGESEDYAGKNMGYFNQPGWNYEDFFFTEFIPYIDVNYRTKSIKEGRAIAGLSMGGGGAAAYAQRHPDFFSSCCSLSGLLSENVNRAPRKNVTTDFVSSVKAAEPFDFVANSTAEQIESLRSVRWYIDCGDDDYLLDCSLNTYMLMRTKGIPAQLRVREGAHKWLYWQQGLPDVLKFISIGFK